MKLIEITDKNKQDYLSFESCYNDNLFIFMSRIYPNENALIKWCYINVEDMNIGSVWLETVDKDTVKLGIFIADEGYRNNGYGTNAIKYMICFAKDKGYKSVILNVRTNNARAYSLYRELGFIEIKRFTKENGIDVISMELNL